MRFVYPWLLSLLLAVPLLGAVWFWMARQGRRNLDRLVSPTLQPRLMPPHSALRFDAQLGLALAGLALLAAAAARPQWGSRDERVTVRSRNLVIAIDVSRSMLARDVHPNRLERAKVDVMDLIGELKGDRAALLAFRRRGALLCPLTTDYAYLRQALDGLSIDSAPRGETDLADAIRKSLEALAPAQDDHNAILLISDGEDLAGEALAAAQEARRRGVPIFTVGIGDTAGAPVPDEAGTGAITYQGAQVRSRLTEETLTAIARASGGSYVPLGTASTVQTTLGSIFRQHLRQIAASEQQEQLARRRVERYQWFLFPALGLLLIAAGLSRGRLSAVRTRPAHQPPPLPIRLVSTILLFAAGLAHGATNDTPAEPTAGVVPAAPAAAGTNAVGAAAGRAAAREAQSLYRHGKYKEAADAYVAASRNADTEEAQTYLFNAALARQQAHAGQEAIDLLEPLIHTPRTGDRAAELLGVTAFQMAAATNGPEAAEAKLNAVEAAGSAFQQALRNQPQDTRRSRNLARAEQQLPSLREESRIARLLKEHDKTPPDQLIATLLQEQRALLRETPAAFTNEAPEQIRQLEALAERQDRNGDLWVPLKRAVLQSPALTNAEQRAQFERIVESTRDAMNNTAGRLRDLDPEACLLLTRTEPPVYLFWSGMAAPPALLDEDIALQSNVIARADRPIVPYRPDQPEALKLTGAFQQRFPAWADQMVQAAQTDTNAPTLKPEDRAEIERLTRETIPLQEKPTPASQRQSLKNLLRIRELLPKQKQSQQQQPQQQPQPKGKPQEKPQPQQPPPPKDKPDPKQEQPKPEPQQQQPPKNVQDLLQRALQREKEHETQKQQQMEHLPMLPGERDW
jgi:Ca-activated chloride channel family protein